MANNNGLDKSRLGVDKEIFSTAEIRLIREDAPIVDFINRIILEDNNDEITVIKHKEDETTNRPYFVVYNPILHAKVAYYMTSSVPEERMALENKIWGHHYIKTPDYIYHYLDNSSIKGKVNENKLHLIDKDRFLFITEESMMQMESRAKRAENIHVSMNTHYNNAFKIEDVLKRDLRPEQFEKIVRQGRKERWVYIRKTQNPVVYSPTAMYLLLYVNAMSNFTNSSFRATPELLDSRCDTLLKAIGSLGEYIRQDEKLKELQRTNEVAYKVFKNARYYNGIPSGTMKNMQLADASPEVIYGNLCGHPINYTKLPIEGRIAVELNRYKITNTKKREEITSIVLSLLKEEDRVRRSLSGAASLAIEDLNKNPREKLNLSSYEMDPSLLDSIKEIAKDDSMREFVEEAALEYYKELQEEFIKEAKRKKVATNLIREKEAIKEQNAEYEKLANEYALAELTKQINTRFLGTFDGVYKQYVQGHLIPTKSDMDEFEKLLVPMKPLSKSMVPITMGAGLHLKLNQDMVALNAFNDRISAMYYGLKEAEDGLEELLQTQEGKLAESLLTDITNQQIKVRLRCTGLTEREKLAETKKVVAEMLNPSLNPFALDYTSVSIEAGSVEGEILAYMQDIANYKAELRGLVNLKGNKQKLIDAIEIINDPATIQRYLQSYNLVKSFDQSVFTKGGSEKPKTLEEISAELDNITSQITQGKLTNKDYTRLEEEIYGILSKMNNLISDTNARIKEKGNLDAALLVYEKNRTKVRERIKNSLEIATTEFIEQLEEYLADVATTENLDDRTEVILRDEKGREQHRMSGEEYKEASQSFLNTNANMLEVSNYTYPEKSVKLTEEIFDKCFPPIDVLEANISKKIAKATNPKEVNAILRGEIEKVESVKGDLRSFLSEFVQPEYKAILNNASAILNSQNIWNMEVDSLKQLNSYTQGVSIPEDDVERDFYEAQVRYLNEGVEQLKAEAEQNVKAFKDIMYNQVQEIVNKMDYRIDLSADLSSHLTHNYTSKAKREMMVAMPSAITGDYGIGERLYQLAGEKAKHVTILTDIITGQAKDDADHKRITRCVIDRVQAYCYDKLEEEYGSQDEEMGSVLEAMRKFALRGEKEYDFVTRTNGLKKHIELYLKGASLGLTTGNRETKRASKSIAKEIVANIPKIKKMFKENKMFESCGEEEELITTLIEQLYEFSENMGAFL